MSTSSESKEKSSSYASITDDSAIQALTTKWDAIIVGSGMGGMACGAALAKFGKHVLVLEQHYKPGGFTHTFGRKGYRWDVGVHCVGEMDQRAMPGKLLSWLTNGTLQWESMGPIYETFHFPDGFSIEFPDTARAFKKCLIDKFPTEEKAINEYFALIRKVANSAKSHFVMKVVPEWVDRIASPFMSGEKFWSLTTKQVLDGLTSNDKLKAVLAAQWGYYGSTPSHSSFAIHALTVRHFWYGGYFPVAGSSSIATSLLKTIKDAGGQTIVRADVAEIIITKGRARGVRLKSGQEFTAPIIISAAGAKATVDSLVPELTKQTTWAREIHDLSQSPPHVSLYLGFEGDIQSAGATRSNQWFFESWDMEDDKWNVADPNSFANVLYMSFPSLKDPHHEPGPEKRHTGEVVTFVPWEAFSKWTHTRRGNRDPEYMEFKKTIEDRMLAQLRKHVPKLMEHVRHYELSTPLSTTHFTHAPMGAIYGLEATPRRFTNKSIRTRTPVKGLYLAGGDVATLGVTGALIGGVLAAGTVKSRILSKLI